MKILLALLLGLMAYGANPTVTITEERKLATYDAITGKVSYEADAEDVVAQLFRELVACNNKVYWLENPPPKPEAKGKKK